VGLTFEILPSTANDRTKMTVFCGKYGMLPYLVTLPVGV
jgi:hypothetical protein